MAATEDQTDHRQVMSVHPVQGVKHFPCVDEEQALAIVHAQCIFLVICSLFVVITACFL